MGGVANHVRRGEAVDLLACHPVEELQASRAIVKVGREVVHQRIGIQEQPEPRSTASGAAWMSAGSSVQSDGRFSGTGLT
jgi:hypothetical protein